MLFQGGIDLGLRQSTLPPQAVVDCGGIGRAGGQLRLTNQQFGLKSRIVFDTGCELTSRRGMLRLGELETKKRLQQPRPHAAFQFRIPNQMKHSLLSFAGRLQFGRPPGQCRSLIKGKTFSLCHGRHQPIRQSMGPGRAQRFGKRRDGVNRQRLIRLNSGHTTFNLFLLIGPDQHGQTDAQLVHVRSHLARWQFGDVSNGGQSHSGPVQLQREARQIEMSPDRAPLVRNALQQVKLLFVGEERERLRDALTKSTLLSLADPP